MELVRSTLTPITHNLPPPIRRILISLLGSSCYTTLVHDIAPTSPCVSLLMSKALGVGIIAASPLVKLDQIRILIRSQSAVGVSLLAYVLEMVAYGIGLAYNARKGNPISTYGETGLIAAQDVVIAVLVLRYQGRGGAATGSLLAGLVAAAWAMADERVVGEDALTGLQLGANVLGVFSKAPQIWTVWREGGTGQLSAFAVFMYLAGSLARIFTTMREVGDKMILYGFVAGFLLNVVLAIQMVYYWNSPTKIAKVAEKGKQPEKIAIGSSTATASKPKGPTTRRRG
ncbi:hypothetical protein MMC07_005488 [Pseudocyphellaria aurata]|nr:hypothetical protein [Pseudocyphellaria aurata]